MELSLPLTGREEEVAFLESALRDRGGAVVAGAAGVGKTRLADETARRLDGWYVARTAVSASTAELPLAGLVGLNLHAADPSVGGHAGLFSRMAAELVARAAGRPLLVLVDDAHLLDDLSAGFVHQLLVSRAAAVLLTVRSREPAPPGVVRVFKDGHAPRLELQPLSLPEFVALVESALGGAVEPRTTQALWKYADGNVLFLRELLQDGIETGTLRQADGAWRWRPTWAVGPRLAELVAERMGRLDETRRRLIEVVSIAEPLSAQLVERLVPGVDLASEEARGLIRCDAAGSRFEIRAAHPLFSEIVRAEMSPLLRRRHQVVIATAIEACGLHRQADVLRVARLRLEAGAPLDPAFLRRAAAAARRQFAPELAEQLARRSLEIEPSFEARLVAAATFNDRAMFSEAAAALAELVGTEPDDLARQQLARERAWAVFQRGDGIDEARRILEQAEAATSDLGLRLIARGALALLFTYAGRFLDAAQIGMPLLDAEVDDVHRLSYVAPVGACLVMSGRADRALALADELAPVAERYVEQEPRARGHIWQMRANALLLSGRISECMELLQGRLSSSATPLLAPGHMAYARAKLGRALILNGRPCSAVVQLDAAAHVLREVDPDNALSWCLSLNAEAHALTGDLATAGALAREAVVLDGPNSAVFAGDARRARAWVLAAQGRLSDAVAELVLAADEQEARAQPAFALYALHDAVRLGEHRLAERVATLAGALDGPGPSAIALHAGACEANDPQLLRAAGMALSALGFHAAATEALGLAAAAWSQRGFPARAAAAARERDDEQARCDVPPLVAAPVGQQVALTRREREVALLAARRHNNAEIARALSLSVRTVESHLYAVYAKLGVSDRAELSTSLLDT